MKLKLKIPENLLSIPVVSQMKLMWDFYEESLGQENNNISTISNEELNGIKAFIDKCLEDESLIASDEETVNVANYLVKLFYSLKGTPKVFEYMKNYLGIDFSEDPVYKDFSISMKIGEIETTEISAYFKLLCKFIRDLLYYYELSIIIDTVNLFISSNLTSNIGAGVVTYKEFNITEEG